jgi:hypothetical protein
LPQNISNAKIWLEQNPNLPLKSNSFYKGDIDWIKAFELGQNIYVPILNSNTVLLKDNNIESENKFPYSFLVFNQDENKNYKVHLKVYVTNDAHKKEKLEIVSSPSITFDQHNKLVPNLLKKNPTSANYRNDVAPEPVCEWYGYYEICYDPNTGETTKTLLYTFKICSSDWLWEPNTPGGGNSGGTKPDGIAKEDKIDDSELSGKAKCLNDLLNKKGDSFVKKLLANFAGKSKFDIKIVSKDKVFSKDENNNTHEINGKTIYNSLINRSLITIEISKTRTNYNSNLEAVRTLLHEYIHADITSKLNTDPKDGESDFQKSYIKYGDQHEAMGSIYINSMRDALKAFHKEILTTDYKAYINYYDQTPSDSFYEALAWGGLKDNNIKTWKDLSSEKKAEIEYYAERAAKLSKISPCPED